MHETLRRRILRRLETLPEPQLYQVLDYIEFVESRHGAADTTEVSGLQRWAERLEDGLRKRTLNPSNLREAFQLIAAADRVLGSVAEAGREILGDLSVESAESGQEVVRSKSNEVPVDSTEAPSNTSEGTWPGSPTSGVDT